MKRSRRWTSRPAFHGSIFAFNRVDRLAARNVFSQGKAHTVYNQYGFTIGGPVIRNRTFFFGDYQSTREFRMESFNFTNTPHFNNPNMGFGSAGFGEVTTAIQDQRQIQFGLKLTF